MTTRSRTRTVLVALGLLLAGLAFAAALAVLTTSIASPQIGLRGTPGVLSPADTPTSTSDDGPVRSTRARTATTTDDDPPPASTPRPTATTPPVAATPEPDDDAVDDDTQDDDDGQGRGRGRGRGGDDEDDD